MTCPECELLMGEGEFTTALDEHLAGCPACRLLWDELEANRHALRAMGLEMAPAPAAPVRAAHPWWRWSSAAAAVIISMIAAWWMSRPPKPPHIVSVDVKVTGVAKTEAPVVKAKIPETLTNTPVPLRPAAGTEPLRVKMLTEDPDVVIYWLIETKGE